MCVTKPSIRLHGSCAVEYPRHYSTGVEQATGRFLGLLESVAVSGSPRRAASSSGPVWNSESAIRLIGFRGSKFPTGACGTAPFLACDGDPIARRCHFSLGGAKAPNTRGNAVRPASIGAGQRCANYLRAQDVSSSIVTESDGAPSVPTVTRCQAVLDITCSLIVHYRHTTLRG